LELIFRVPSGVPSVAQIPLSAAKPETISAVPREVSKEGWKEPGPGASSTAREVPASVPSLVQSSVPCSPSAAKNQRRPACTVNRELMGAAVSSKLLTCTVPVAVPSLTQSAAGLPARK
jgi:hypothetical protein